MPSSEDPFDLERFVVAQQMQYFDALDEINAGRKRSHWMWYIFPQYQGLGVSATSQRYAIKSMDEAKAYLQHPVLGPRLVECCEATLAWKDRSANQIFGTPDDLKLGSSATLFASISPDDSVFHKILQAFFRGQADPKTLRLMGLST